MDAISALGAPATIGEIRRKITSDCNYADLVLELGVLVGEGRVQARTAGSTVTFSRIASPQWSTQTVTTPAIPPQPAQARKPCGCGNRKPE